MYMYICTHMCVYIYDIFNFPATLKCCVSICSPKWCTEIHLSISPHSTFYTPDTVPWRACVWLTNWWHKPLGEWNEGSLENMSRDLPGVCLRCLPFGSILVLVCSFSHDGNNSLGREDQNSTLIAHAWGWDSAASALVVTSHTPFQLQDFWDAHWPLDSSLTSPFFEIWLWALLM